LFAAQFALSHGCWLLTYPLAGWVGAKAGVSWSFLILGLVAVAALFIAAKVWPPQDPEVIQHVHETLDGSDPHLAGAERTGGQFRHAHPYVIDSHHPDWPTSV
jgi:hypothetical protein